MRRALVLSLWALLMALAAFVVARAHYSADLSAFLPRSPSPEQRLLVEQLRDGLGSRLILLGIEGADAAARAGASQQLRARLEREPLIASVGNGASDSEEREHEFLFEHRYQLSPAITPERFTVAGLRAAIGDTLSLVAESSGPLAGASLRSDPTGESVALIDSLAGLTAPARADGVWSSRDGRRALLVATLHGSGADIDAQAEALAHIRAAFRDSAAASGLRLLVSGPPVFAVAARATIEHEAVRLSLWSSALIVTLLLLVYRSFTTLALGLLPVASGALAGVAAVALGYGTVHGITLGFGVTLIGESVDYSVYLFVQSQRGAPPSAAGSALWSTIGLGVLTSICGFASLLPSTFPGLAQLGLYSISGLVAAVAATRLVLPLLLPARLPMRPLSALGTKLAHLAARVRVPLGLAAALAAIGLTLLYAQRDRLWNHDLTALSPLPPAAVALDEQLRADLAAPEAGALIVVQESSAQATLERAEAVGARLDALAADGAIGGYDSPARFLPSAGTQRARLLSLPPAPELRERLASAGATLGLQPAAFAPFLEQAEAARRATPLTRADLAGTPFALAVDALLAPRASGWQAVLPLHAVRRDGTTLPLDEARIQHALSDLGAGVVLLDLKRETDRLYGRYLSEAMRLSLTGFGIIVLLLALTLRSARRAAAVLAPLALSVIGVSATLVCLGTRLTILHLIGMLLIVAVGSNYALFFDRRATDADPAALPLTLSSLLIANACTVIGFGVLATSSVPVLHALGITVAPGTALALLLSAGMAPRRLYGTAAAATRPPTAAVP